ncbi:MAG: protein translocase subunit SecF, partial [Clostridia bacterium]|nr:protein translocase subunit SecF [Clostridia bacterium]
MLNVIKSKWICIGISLVIILAGVVSFFIQGFNLDIDFTGGTTITVNMEGKSFDIADVEKLISDTLG